jgi:hypothetical protein
MKGLKDSTTGRFKSNLKEIECSYCKKTFKPRHSSQKYCNNECNGLASKKDHNRKCIICNKEFEAKSMKTRFCSRECYTESGLRAKKGAGNKFWKGGITPINKLIRSSVRYKNWVKSILCRDNYTCEYCGIIGKRMQVHHILSFSDIIRKLKFEQGIENLFEKAMNYDLLWDSTNGQTLCVECHEKTDNYLKNNKK